MAFSGVGKFLSDLTAQTAATDTDLVPIGAPGTLKKITFANLRKALGVDTINTSIGTLTSLSTTTKTSLVDAINEIFTSVDTLNRKLVWVQAGDVTGGTSISLPGAWNELSVMVIGTGTYHTANFSRTQAVSTARSYKLGYYFSSSTYAGLDISISTTSIRINSLFEQGTSQTASARMIVWYR